MRTSKRIIDIKSRALPDGGAVIECHLNYTAPADSAKTAIAKSVGFLNYLCEQYKLGIVVEIHDAETGKILNVTYTDTAATQESRP